MDRPCLLAVWFLIDMLATFTSSLGALVSQEKESRDPTTLYGTPRYAAPEIHTKMDRRNVRRKEGSYTPAGADGLTVVLEDAYRWLTTALSGYTAPHRIQGDKAFHLDVSDAALEAKSPDDYRQPDHSVGKLPT